MSFQVYQAQGLRIYTGDTATVNSYVGLAGELAINTETKSVRILDGINPGGVPLSTAGGVELQGLNIEQLANLLVSSPQDGQALVYEGGKWKNKAVAAADSSGASHMNQLVDVKLTNLQTGESLTYNASISKWENKSLALSDHDHDSKYQLKGNYLTDTSNLSEINNVQITMPEDGQSLVYDAGYQKWINTTLAAVSSGNTSSANFPCFHAVLGGTSGDPRNQTPLLFADVKTNHTNSYDPSTGLFTAPEDGYYYFGTGAHRHAENGYTTLRLNVGGEQISNAWGHDTGSGDSGQLFCSGVKYMSAGDIAYVEMDTGKGTNYMAETYWYFTGFLINASSGSGVDAEITAPENGQALVYQDGKWINSMIAGGSGGGVGSEGFKGCIIQVQHNPYPNAPTSNSQDWQWAQIVEFTPKSAKSKILIMVNYGIGGKGAICLLRDGNPISSSPNGADAYMFWQHVSQAGSDNISERQTMSLVVADEPNTTETITYATQIMGYEQNGIGINPTPFRQGNGVFSAMTIFEIGDESELGGGGSSTVVSETSPIGMVAPFAMSTAPDEWLVCDGSTLNSVANPEYADLFAAIGTTWGGTGASDFKVPDLRGSFLRGIGNGSINGRDKYGPSTVGEFQEDEFQGHYHNIRYDTTGSGGTAINSVGGDNSGVQHLNEVTPGGDAGYGEHDGNGVPRHGSETRSFNAGVLYCIKYKAGSGSATESYFSGIRNVKQAFKSDAWSTDSNDFVDIPGLEVTITPESADSEVFVMLDMMVNVSHYCGEVQLVRNGEYIAQADEAGLRPRSTIVVGIPPTTHGDSQRSSANFLDKPNTTEPVTYKLVARGRKDDELNGAIYINRTDEDRDSNTYDGRGVSSLTVMEVNNNPLPAASITSSEPAYFDGGYRYKTGQGYFTAFSGGNGSQWPFDTVMDSRGINMDFSTNTWTHEQTGKYVLTVDYRHEGGDLWQIMAVTKNGDSHAVGVGGRTGSLGSGTWSKTLMYDVDDTSATYQLQGWGLGTSGLGCNNTDSNVADGTPSLPSWTYTSMTEQAMGGENGGLMFNCVIYKVA